MDNIKIDTVSKDDVINNYKWFKEMPTTNLHPSVMLARCLDSTYVTWGFYIDDVLVGIVIIRDLTPQAVIVGINLKNHTKIFFDLFYSRLKEAGIKELEAYSSLSKDRFEGFSGFTLSYSVYKKEL